MENINEESGRIASLSLFKELYDSEKDVYGVISCFLQEVIVTEAKHSFTLHEITCLLNNTFNFHIPEAVVKTSLGRLDYFLKKEQGKYSANLSEVKSPSLIPKKDEIIKSNNIIIEQIIDFISTQEKREINEEEREEIIHSFCSFILDKSNNQKYSEYISAFVINNKQDPDFINRLKCIKEGVVLYTGIMFNDNISNVGSWNTKLTIFLDTEILFDFAGFNGELFKSLFDEFHSFVKEINQKASYPLIKLRYFPKIKDSVHNYFSKAEYILTGSEIVDPGRPAMNYILNGSKSKSDIIEKKTIFFDLLSKNDILVDDYQDYYEEENYKYNITFHSADKYIEKSIAESIGVDYIKDSLELLNFVSIRRADAGDNNFEHIEYILLSGNITTLQVAWHGDIRQSGKVPLSTSLHFLTDKFWFKLNKGFGANTFPKVFDIMTKAQLLLSSQLNKAVGSKFEELQKRFKSGALDEDQVALAIIDLKKQAKKPEDIVDDNISFVLESISQNNIDKVLEEQEHFKNKAKKHEEENIELKVKLTSKKKELEEKEREINRQNTHAAKSKQELLAEKKERMSALDKSKRIIDKKIEKSFFYKYKISPICLFALYFIVLAILIIKIGWDKIEPFTYVIGLFPFAFSFIYFLISEKTFNPKKFFENKKNKCKEIKYKKFDFDLILYNRLKSEIQVLEKNNKKQ